MLQVLVIALIVLIILMISSVIVANRKLIKNREGVVHLIWTAIITACGYTVFILVPSSYDQLAALTAGLYFLSTDWLVVCLMTFAAGYTHVQPPSKLPRHIICFLAVVDSVSFVVNTFTHHMFDMKRMSDAGMGYWNIQLKPLHSVHRFLSMALYCTAYAYSCIGLSKLPQHSKLSTAAFCFK